jgi:hypothetical protein
MERKRLIEEVCSRHQMLGGKLNNDGVKACQKALKALEDEGRVIRPLAGFYVLSERASDARSSSAKDRPNIKDAQCAVTIGTGDEAVYVSYHEAHRALAIRENRDWWPCKVGSTAKPLTGRMTQLTGMPHRPTVGLVIRADNAKALEKAIHRSLVLADAKIDGGAGSEWFNTSPSRLKGWYERFAESLLLLRTDHRAAQVKE